MLKQLPQSVSAFPENEQLEIVDLGFADHFQLSRTGVNIKENQNIFCGINIFLHSKHGTRKSSKNLSLQD